MFIQRFRVFLLSETGRVLRDIANVYPNRDAPGTLQGLQSLWQLIGIRIILRILTGRVASSRLLSDYIWYVLRNTWGEKTR